MKKLQTWIFALAVAITPVLNPTAHASYSWETVGSAGFSSGSAYYDSLVLDSSGTPYVAYRDGSNDVSVMKFNGTGWDSVGGNITPVSWGMAYDVSLALDSSDTPYVAYRDPGNGNVGSVYKFNGTSWDLISGASGFPSGVAIGGISLAFDSNDDLYMSYDDGANSGATVIKYNGTSWSTVGSAGFSAGSIDITSLAFDSSNTLYVAYDDGANIQRATVMKFNGTSWETVGSAGFSDTNAEYISLALDSSDTPYVAFRCGNDDKANVMKFNGTSWENVGPVGLSTGAANYTSLAFDSSDTPYITYNESGAKLMKFNGTAWETVGDEPSFSAGAAYYTSLAIDSSNTAYVIYSDGTNGSKATVMKATFTPDGPVENTDVTATVNAALTLGIDSNTLTFDVTPTVNSGQDNAQTSALSVSSNSYSGYVINAALNDDATSAPNQLSGTAASGNAIFTSAADANLDNYFQFMVDAANSVIADTGAETIAAAGTEFNGSTNVITTTGAGNALTNGDTVTVDYDFNVNFDTLPDTYGGTLVYTLSAGV